MDYYFIACYLRYKRKKFYLILLTRSLSATVAMESSALTMSTHLKQRAVIEFLTAEGVNPTIIHRRLEAVYGEDTVDRSTVNRWAIRFRTIKIGKGTIEDKPRTGRSVSATDEKHQKQVDELIQNNRRITQCSIAVQVGISKERVGYIIEQLNYRKICSRWVPRRLTEENKQQRKHCCEQLLRRYRKDGEDFLFSIVTGDESWIHHYDPEEKRQSMEYRHFTSPQCRKFKRQLSAKKVLLTAFWDAKHVYLAEYLEGGTTVNSSRYIETLKHLRRRVCRVRNCTKPIILHHDNARPHTSRATAEALARLKFETIPHPPYSPDLAPCDFYLFPNLKRDLKGIHFTTDDEVKDAVKSWIKERPSEFLVNGMRQLVHRWETCIAVNGDYVEK